ncbi:MAG: aminoglycoside phosphotransferase family protein [Gammaproteobacteria bacterium]
MTIEDGAVPSAEHVRGWLSAALGAADDDVVVTGPVYDGSHSRIFKASLPGLPFPVAVKQCRDPITGAPAPEEAEIQHAALRAIAEGVPPGRNALAPKPVMLLREHAVVVCGWLEGRSVGGLCRDPRVSPADVERAIALSGAWLRDFHRARPAEPGPVDVRTLLDVTVETLREAGIAEQRADVARILRLLEDTIDAAASQPVPRAWVHGDCKPDNLVVDGDEVVGLDAGARYVNVVLLDVAHFLNHLELHSMHPGALRIAGRLEALTTAFWRSYDPEGSVPALPAAWTRLAMALRLRAEYLAHARGMRRRYVEWCFRRLLRRRAAALERAA